VIAIVCSKCAERVPSTLTTVHRSGIVRVPGIPTFTIGSIAIVRPGCRRTPRLASVVRHLRILVKPDPDPVPNQIAHDAEPGRFDYALHRRADVAYVILGSRRLNSRSEGLLRDIEKLLRLRIDFPDGDGGG